MSETQVQDTRIAPVAPDTQEPDATGEPSVAPVGVWKSGVLVHSILSYWRGRAVLRPEDINLQPEQIPDFMRLGSKLLIPVDALKRFQEIQSKLDYLLRRWSFPFVTGARFAPYTALPRITGGVQEIEGEFWQVVNEFLENYDRFREEMLTTYGQYRAALEGAYPEKAHLKRRFRFSIYVYTVSNVSPTTLGKATETGSKLLATATNYEERFKADLDAFVNESVVALRAQLGETVKRIQEKTERGDRITERDMSSIRNAIAQFRALDFADDEQVGKQLTQLSKLAGPDSGASVNSDEETRQAFTQIVGNIATATERTDDVETVTATYKRKLILDDDETK